MIWTLVWVYFRVLHCTHECHESLVFRAGTAENRSLSDPHLNKHKIATIWCWWGLYRWQIYSRWQIATRPVTDTLPSSACQSLLSSWGDFHSHKGDTKSLNKLPLYLITPTFSMDGWRVSLANCLHPTTDNLPTSWNLEHSHNRKLWQISEG